jgi:hypothetical protein
MAYNEYLTNRVREKSVAVLTSAYQPGNPEKFYHKYFYGLFLILAK